MRLSDIDALSLGQERPLELLSFTSRESDEIIEGVLFDPVTNRRIPIIDHIPRFTQVAYAKSFSDQWNRYRLVQIDRFNGTTLSRDRLFRGTRWSPDELKGRRILEVGCGAGRFTQVFLDAGAFVTSLDGHGAVDACFKNNGPHPRLCVVQADLYDMPFKKNYFDKVFCYGVLQHTPDVKKAFFSLLAPLKPGGELAVDCYRKDGKLDPWKSKYLYRPLTKRLPRGWLLKAVEWYVPRWLPIDTFIKRIPVLRRLVGLLVPCWNYSSWPLTKEQALQWSILDTFDALSPAHDFPQTSDTILKWFKEARLTNIDVQAGGGMVIANGVKPSGDFLPS